MNNILEKIYTNELQHNEFFMQQLELFIQLKLSQKDSIQKNSPSENEPPSTTNNHHQISSYQLGQNGQQYVIFLLQQLFKQVQDQSQIPHVGDILVEYNDHKIMVEVKNKQQITKDDIEKFKDDSKKFDLSIFVSLQTDFIYQIGQFDIQDNLIYLSKDYINIHTFTLLKSYMDLYFQKQIQNGNTTTTNEDEYINLQIEKDLKTISIFKNNLKDINELFKESQLKHQELEIINQKINAKINAYIFNLSEYQNLRNVNYEIQKQELQQLIKNTPQSKLRKSQLIKKFDALRLQQYTIEQIVNIFKPNEEEKENSTK